MCYPTRKHFVEHVELLAKHGMPENSPYVVALMDLFQSQNPHFNRQVFTQKLRRRLDHHHRQAQDQPERDA